LSTLHKFCTFAKASSPAACRNDMPQGLCVEKKHVCKFVKPINLQDMEIEGKIIFDLPLQEGVSKAGNHWKKKEWVLETPGMYPRKVKFHVFGDRVDQPELKFEVGKSYVCQCDIESREFNGRWYTDVSVYSARVTGSDVSQPGAQPQGFGAPAAGFVAAPSAPVADPFDSGDNNTDDLPF